MSLPEEESNRATIHERQEGTQERARRGRVLEAGKDGQGILKDYWTQIISQVVQDALHQLRRNW